MAEPRARDANPIRGVAAEIVNQITQVAAEINALDIGKVVVHIAHGRVHIEIRRSYPPVRISEGSSKRVESA